ncbi:MAG: alpha/beta hydrolase [Gammaproteobacteria bacterium]|nr:alpha/beta hydrolase [Gammaproteobacteria bacterium]
MKARFLDVAGVPTRVLYEGEDRGETLLLIHGFGSSADTWMRNIDPLAERFHVIAPDLVGHGFSGAVDLEGGPPHPKALAHLFGVLAGLGIDRFVPCGSSYGGLLGALMYFEAPERVPRLIINGSGSTFNSEAELAEALQGTKRNSSIAMLDTTLANCRTRSQGSVHDPDSIPEALAFMRLTSYSQPHILESWRSQLEAMMDLETSRPWRIIDRLEQIDVPTLVVWGRQDPRGRYEQAVAGVARMPDARLITYEQCGHLPFLEQPDRYNADVVRFLGR